MENQNEYRKFTRVELEVVAIKISTELADVKMSVPEGLNSAQARDYIFSEILNKVRYLLVFKEA